MASNNSLEEEIPEEYSFLRPYLEEDNEEEELEEIPEEYSFLKPYQEEEKKQIVEQEELPEEYSFLQPYLEQEQKAVRRPLVSPEAPTLESLGITPKEPEPPKDNSWDTLRGLEVSMRQVPQLAYGVAGLVGATSEQITGYGESLRDWGFRGYQDWAESMEPISKETDDVTVAWQKAKEGDIGALIDWAQYGVGYALGQLGETAAVAVLGGIAGGAAGAAGGPTAIPAAAGGAVVAAAGKTGFKALAKNLVEKAISAQAQNIVKKQAAKEGIELTGEQLAKRAQQEAIKRQAGREIGSNAAVFANAIGMQLGAIYGSAEEKAREEGTELTGLDLARIWGSGIATGGLEGVVDKFGLDLLKGKFTEVLPAGRLAGAAVAGGVGTVGEAATEAVQTVGERFGAGRELLSDEAINEYINASALGGIGGGVIGGAGGFISGNPKENAAAKAKVSSEANKDIAPATAETVARQADSVIAETVQETPEQKVARLQEEARAAAGDIELEEEPSVSGLPPERIKSARWFESAARNRLKELQDKDDAGMEDFTNEETEEFEFLKTSPTPEQVAERYGYGVAPAVEPTAVTTTPPTAPAVTEPEPTLTPPPAATEPVTLAPDLTDPSTVSVGPESVRVDQENAAATNAFLDSLEVGEYTMFDANGEPSYVLKITQSKSGRKRHELHDVDGYVTGEQKTYIGDRKAVVPELNFGRVVTPEGETKYVRSTLQKRVDVAPATPTPTTPTAPAPEAPVTPTPTEVAPTTIVPPVTPEQKKVAETVAPAAVLPEQEPADIPDTRGQNRQFHGAREPIQGIAEGYYNAANIYGGESTFYTTDAVDIAAGYQRRKPNAVVYEVTQKAPVNFFNMEERRPVEEWIKIFNFDVEGIPRDEFFDVGAELAGERTNGTPNLREIMDEMRDEAPNEMMSRDELQEYFSSITSILERQGYGGMTHIGGLKTKRPQHNVKIYFKPYEQIEIKPVDVRGNPVTPEVPTAEPPALAPLRRVVKAEQTEEDVSGLVGQGLVELYNGQPVITQAGLETLPEAERPRLTPEARKIQIDTRTSEAAAEAISKNLRIGVDQVPPDVSMPAGWTIEGDIYIPPVVEAAPAPQPEARESRRAIVTPQQDRDYLDAVERGDLDAASRVVEDAAKRAGYTISVFHGTSNLIKFTEFKIGDIGFHFGDIGAAEDRAQQRWGNEAIVKPFYLVDGNFAKVRDVGDFGDSAVVAEELLRTGYISQQEYNSVGSISGGGESRNIKQLKQLRQILVDKGYDGISYTNRYEGFKGSPQTSYAIFNSSLVKSAAPVTYDDAGNIIPPSQRFQQGEADIRYARGQAGAGMTTDAVRARLESLGFGVEGMIRIVEDPQAAFEGRTIIQDGKAVRIELNASALRDNAAIDRVLNHEFAEAANADGALNRLVERLTPKEKKEINDAITRLGYEERVRTTEEAARAIEALAAGWKGRGFFERAVARVEAWGSKLGLKLTRRAAEYIAARNLSDINAGFKAAYNRFINVRGEAREGKIDPKETNRILIGNFYQEQIKAETKTISPTGANPFNHGMLGMSAGLRWRFRTKSGTLAVSDSSDTDGIESIKRYIEKRGFKVNSVKSLEQAFDETHRGDAPSIDSVFSPEAFRRVGEGFKSRSKIIRMSIDDFLKLATQLPREQSQEAQKAFDAGIEWDSIPNFETRTDENGVAKIIGHEGRHRALVLKRAGYTEMPVAIIDRAIRWSEQTDPQSYDYVENFPTQLESERTKERIPFPFNREQGLNKYSPQTLEVRESRREPATTFTEESPEAKTLSNLKASMDKVDGASEAKGGKPETQKVSEIAANWMEQGGDERELQDAITENTNLSPVNAAKVAKVIAKQYGLQQQIAETGAVIAEPAPEVEGAPRKTSVQRLIEQAVGVRRPIVKLEVNEKTALKDQIRLKAREARETRKARKEAARDLAEAVTQYVKDNQLRGPVRALQTMSLAKRALKLDVNNEKAVDRYIMYVERVVENANYDKDLSDAKALRKRAKDMAKKKNIGPEQKKVLEAIGNINPSLLDNPFEYNVLTERYLLGFLPVTSRRYSVMPDAEARQYLESLEEQMKRNQAELDRAELERFFEAQAGFAEQRGLSLEEAQNLLNEDGDISQIIQDYELEKRKATEEMLLNLAQNAQRTLKTYDDSANTARQKELISFMNKVKLESITSEEKKRFVRFANNILANGETFGVEQFEAVAKAQERSAEALKDKRLSKKMNAWIGPLSGGSPAELVKKLSLITQSEVDTLKNVFGREAVGAFRRILGLLDLDVAQTASTTEKEKVANKVGNFYKNLKKKYGEEAVGRESNIFTTAAAYFIQAEGNKTQEESIAYRRRLWTENIEELRKSERTEDREEAEIKQRALETLTGNSNAEILNSLKSTNPAAYEQLMWWKDQMHPEYKPFLKDHVENFRNQANNYDNIDYLSIHYKWDQSPELPSDLDAQEFDDVSSFRIKQAANSIKRKDHPSLPVNTKTGVKANIDVSFGYNQYNALTEQLEKAYTAPAWEAVYAFTRLPDFEQIMGGKTNADFVRNILRNIKATRTRKAMLDDENQIIGGTVALTRRISTQAALGGVLQPFKQIPDQLFKLFATTGRWDLISRNIVQTLMNYSSVRNNPLLNKLPIGRRGDARAGSQFAAEFNELARKVEASVTNKKWTKYKELMTQMGEFWMTPLRGSDTWIAKVSWMSYYESELNKKDIKMESWEREAELFETDPIRQEAAAQAEYLVDFYAGASDPTKMAALSKQGNNGYREFSKLIFLSLNSFALQQKSALISDARDLVLRSGSRKDALAGIVGTVGGMVAFHGMRIFLIGGLIYPAAMMVLKGIFGIDMDEPEEEEQEKQLRDNWRKMKASIYANIVAGGAGQFLEGKSIDAFNRTMYLWDAHINPDEMMDDKGEFISFSKYEKEKSPFYRFRSYSKSEFTFGLADVLTEQAVRSVDQTAQLLSDEEMSLYTGNEQAYALFATGVEWAYFFRLMDTDLKRVTTKLKRDMDKQVEEREKELRAIRNR